MYTLGRTERYALFLFQHRLSGGRELPQACSPLRAGAVSYTHLDVYKRQEYTRSAELISVRTTGMGSLYNLHYHVRLVSPEVEKQFLDAIRCRNGNLDIVCGKVPQVKEAL